VRLEALTALHPNAAMLTELDRRLAVLQAQRARILGQSSPAPAPDGVSEATPALPAIASPAPEPLAASPTAGVAVKDLVALRATLTRQHERELIRRQRSLQTTAAADLQREYARLEAEADARRQQAHQDARQPISAAELRLGQAAQRLATQEDWKRRADRQAEEADRKAETLRLYADAHPKDKRAAAQAAAQDAWCVRAHAAAAAQEKEYKTVKQKYYELDTAAFDAQQALTDALQTIDDDLATARKTAADASAGRLADAVAQLKVDVRKSIDVEVAKEAARLTQEAKQEMPPSATPTIIDSEVPAGRLALESAAVARGVRGGETAAAGSHAAALRAIDAAVADLQTERARVREAIRLDTRAMAITLAAQHGYLLAIDRRAGRDLGAPMRRWLHDYWTATP
jgi:hypothetical protein